MIRQIRFNYIFSREFLKISVVKIKNITIGMQLDYKWQNEELKHFYSVLGVNKVNSKITIYIKKTDGSANTFQ